MNIYRPNNYLKIQPAHFNLNEIQVNKNNNQTDVNQVLEQNALKESLIQTLKQWEETDNSEKEKQVRWDLSRVPLKYYVSKGNHIHGFEKEFVSVISSCFLEWSRASFGKIRFLKCINENEADIIIKWADTVVLGRKFECGHNNLELIGSKINKAKISVVVYPLIDKLSPHINRVERVRRTLLHEIGHSLGLKHSENPNDIMYHRGISNKQISGEDSQKLLDLYKKPDVNNFKF